MRRVSVIVPTHNRATFLPAHLDRVLKQAFTTHTFDYEVIYVNDSSTDATESVLQDYTARYPERLRVVHAAYGAPGPTRNAGVRTATGELLLFTDDDVMVPEHWVEGMVSHFDRHHTDALCGGVEPGSMATPVERYLHYRVQGALGRSPRTIAAAPMMNFLVTREAFDLAGGFLEDPLRAAEDWEFCYRLIKAGATITYDDAVKVTHAYQSEWEPAAQRMREAGAAGVRIWLKHHRSALLYTLYSLLRSGTAPIWAPIWYPLDLYGIALRMEKEFALARLHAYFQT